MRKTKLKSAAKRKAVSKLAPPRRAGLRSLEAGQVWRVGDQNLQVSLVGKLLVHYKLAPPNAVRVSNSVGGRGAVEKYLKSKKAVLLKTVKVDGI